MIVKVFGEVQYNRTSPNTFTIKDVIYDSERSRVYTLYDEDDSTFEYTVLACSDSANNLDYIKELRDYKIVPNANLYDGNGQLYTFLQNFMNTTVFVLIRWNTPIGSINSFIYINDMGASTSDGIAIARFNSDNSAIYVVLNNTLLNKASICKVNTNDLTSNIS